MKGLLLAVTAAACLTPLVAQQPTEKAAPILTSAQTLSGHARLVRCLAYAPDGRLVSGGQDRRINLWSRDGKLLRRMQPPQVPG